jgi:hypothetical protein
MARGLMFLCLFVSAALVSLLGGWVRDLPVRETANHDSGGGASTEGERASTASTIEDGGSVTSLTITRARRQPSEVASRAAVLASEIVGSECLPREALEWADNAQLNRAKIEVGRPFSCASNIEVSYLGYYDRLIVRDVRSRSPPPSQLVQPPTESRPSLGIGKSSARAIAAGFVTQQLIPTGLVDEAWAMVGSRRVIDGMVDVAGGASGSKVREFRFGYRRHLEGVPLLDSFLEIAVDSTGVVRGIVLADIITSLGEQRMTRRSETKARALLSQLANARADGWNPEIDATVKQSYVAYVLPYDLESVSTPPVLWGEILYKHGVIVSPGEHATLSLVDPTPELTVLVPWSGKAVK